MSFLETDDDRAALEEALRFIDEFAPAPGALDALDAPKPSAPADPKLEATSERKHPKRVRDPAVYVRRRSKQKSEVAELRKQAKALERQLLALRRGRRLADSYGDTVGSTETQKARIRALTWMAAATKEQLKRQTAELTNAQLRQLLVAQWAASRSLLEHVVPMPVEIECELIRFLMSTRPYRLAPSLPIGNASAVADMSAQLLVTAQRLVQEARASQSPAVSAVANEHSVKHDADVGMYAEARGAAPLGGNAEEMLAFMQDMLCTMKFPPHVAIRRAGMTITRKKREMADVALLGSPVRLSGISVLHQSRDEDCLVFAYSSLLFHPSGQLCLREGGWFAVKRSPWNEASECEFRSCSRVSPQVCGSASTLHGVAIADVQLVVLAALAEASKRRLQAVQRGMLLAAGRHDLAGHVPSIDPCVQAAVYRHT